MLFNWYQSQQIFVGGALIQKIAFNTLIPLIFIDVTAELSQLSLVSPSEIPYAQQFIQ